jgi:hypothetical protein
MDLYRYFYEVTIFLLVVLLLYYGNQFSGILSVLREHQILLGVPFFIAFAIIEVFYQLTWKNNFKERKDFIGKLKEASGWDKQTFEQSWRKFYSSFHEPHGS